MREVRELYSPSFWNVAKLDNLLDEQWMGREDVLAYSGSDW
jgi:hypothetical protein